MTDGELETAERKSHPGEKAAYLCLAADRETHAAGKMDQRMQRSTT